MSDKFNGLMQLAGGLLLLAWALFGGTKWASLIGIASFIYMVILMVQLVIIAGANDDKKD